MMEKGSATITQSEIINTSYMLYISSESPILLAWKNAGVPMDGQIVPRLKKGLVYTSYYDEITRSMIVHWEPKSA